ncbi:MAG: AMP-binding protein [Terrimesophilobacter sp.]
MSRALTVIGDDAEAVLSALRRALEGGAAILPLAEGEMQRARHGSIPEVVDDRVALVVQSSGSTGAPKRVALSADALLASAAASDEALDGPGQWILALPAHYIAGINVLVRSIVAGTEPILAPRGHVDPHVFVDTASQFSHPVRYASLVPAQLASLIGTETALETLRSFSRILIGGQRMPDGLLVQALELGLNVTRSYGSSETSGGCVYDGVPIGDTSVRVSDGEVQIAGSVLAEGYLDDDERTAQSFRSDADGRWYRTSDSGVITGGVLRVTGRLDDVIVSGGVNVSLAAVERVVTSLDGLGDAVVVARDDSRWGEVPIVFSTGVASLESVRAAVASQLGVQARPAEVITVESIPLLPSGKPDRVALRSRQAIES